MSRNRDEEFSKPVSTVKDLLALIDRVDKGSKQVMAKQTAQISEILEKSSTMRIFMFLSKPASIHFRTRPRTCPSIFVARRVPGLFVRSVGGFAGPTEQREDKSSRRYSLATPRPFVRARAIPPGARASGRRTGCAAGRPAIR